MTGGWFIIVLPTLHYYNTKVHGFKQLTKAPHLVGMGWKHVEQQFLARTYVGYIPKGSHMLHGAGIFTNICPKNHPVL